MTDDSGRVPGEVGGHAAAAVRVRRHPIVGVARVDGGQEGRHGLGILAQVRLQAHLWDYQKIRDLLFNFSILLIFLASWHNLLFQCHRALQIGRQFGAGEICEGRGRCGGGVEGALEGEKEMIVLKTTAVRLH